jgi:hypothetical protein
MTCCELLILVSAKAEVHTQLSGIYLPANRRREMRHGRRYHLVQRESDDLRHRDEVQYVCMFQALAVKFPESVCLGWRRSVPTALNPTGSRGPPVDNLPVGGIGHVTRALLIMTSDVSSFDAAL